MGVGKASQTRFRSSRGVIVKWTNGNTASISWADYQSKVNPWGIKNQKDRRRFDRERKRWTLADKDEDDSLTMAEYKVDKVLNIDRY